MKRMRALLLFCLLLGITACSRSPEAATPVKLPKFTFTHDWVPRGMRFNAPRVQAEEFVTGGKKQIP